MNADARRLVILAKSRWDPPMRREHALAQTARAAGLPVLFVECASDIRTFRAAGRLGWLRRLACAETCSEEPALSVLARSTIVPGHRGRLAEAAEVRLARLQLRNCGLGRRDVVLATLPWQWPLAERLPAGRRVLDVTDDWTALVPGHAARIRALYLRAGAGADAVVAASACSQEFFAGRQVTLVRNGVAANVLEAPRSAPPRGRTLAYLGTFSERFDAPLVQALLDRLPDWTIELYGPCAYAGRAGKPAAELDALIHRPDRRARWHGPVDPDQIPAVLDGADVLLLPSRAGFTRGQDSMKVYDYAARGRPMVLTSAAADGASELPPGTLVADDPIALADAVCDGAAEPESNAAERARWASQHSWSARWPEWSAALLGSGVL